MGSSEVSAVAHLIAPANVRKAAVIGTGSVGASWIALMLAKGMAVAASDPRPTAKAEVCEFLDKIWPTLRAIGAADMAAPPLEMLTFHETAAAASAGADFVQENVPERLALKAQILCEIDAVLPPDRVIGSSTGGIAATLLQEKCRHPERVVILHPFNPAHLVTLVEVIGGKQTAPETVDWAMQFAGQLGKVPIQLLKELPGHLTNRLQFALLREAVNCLVAGVASARDIDIAIAQGLGPRWTVLGGLLTMHLAGGLQGMEGILNHAGAAIEEWWKPSAQPSLTPEIRATLIAAAAEVADGRTIPEWMNWRDTKLVDLLLASKTAH